MKKTLLIIIALFLYKCSKGNKFFSRDENTTINKILSIQEYSSCFLLNTIDIISQDTVSIISIKEEYYQEIMYEKAFKEEEFYKKIELNDSITFKLRDILYRGNLQGHPIKSAIIKTDTIWEGRMDLNHRIYISVNSVGLQVYNKKRGS